MIFFAGGCHFSAGIGRTPEQLQPALNTAIMPSIEGEWSEPVNGVRMKMMHVMPYGGKSPDLTLLIFTQNVSDKPVDVPRIKPETFVEGLHIEKDSRSITNANLRIIAEPADGQKPPQSIVKYAAELEELDSHNPIQPGEIRIFALKVVDDVELQYLQQIAPDTIYAERITWPGFDDKRSIGRWRLHAIYLPSGFNPPDAELKWLVDPQWLNRQIDLPVTLFTLEPWHYHQKGEINQLQDTNR